MGAGYTIPGMTAVCEDLELVRSTRWEAGAAPPELPAGAILNPWKLVVNTVKEVRTICAAGEPVQYRYRLSQRARASGEAFASMVVRYHPAEGETCIPREILDLCDYIIPVEGFSIGAMPIHCMVDGRRAMPSHTTIANPNAPLPPLDGSGRPVLLELGVIVNG
jgi:hypothetical protein